MSTKPIPSDPELYERVKREVYKKRRALMAERWKKLGKDPKLATGHSAYASGHVVQEYKRRFAQKHGSRKKPYKGQKPTATTGLQRWFTEAWMSDTGETRYTSKDSVYRPTKRVTKDTPVTFLELSPSDIARAKRTKGSSGHVRRFTSPK